MRRRVLLGFLLPLMGALWLASATPPAAAEDEPIVQILQHAKHADKAAVQARALGWTAATLGGVNLIVLVLVVLRLSGMGWTWLGTAEWPIRAIRRRQMVLAKSIAELNAHFEDVGADRKYLHEILKSINDQLRATQEQIDATAALQERTTPAKRQ
ncbi:MAG: hypothetical protein ACHQF3_04255 [Alphaproteobacteria bacterium]